MILGALVDAGVQLDGLRAALAKLGVHGYTLSRQPAQRGGVSGTLVTVELDEEGSRPRGWGSFISVIEESSLAATVKERASAVFHRLVEAEAVVHRTTADKVHLHELGTVDTLVDVVGSVVGLDMLGIERLYCSPFPTGSGVVHSAHGVLPVPAPATSALFAMAKAPVVPPPGNKADAGEMVTPTGAAILTTLATFRQPAMNMERVAYGLGSRDSRDYPNALGLWLGEEVGGLGHATDLSMLETNVDDMAAELFGYVQERLFELGARDVWFTPIQMKKNRPGTMISVIVPAELETSAIGVLLRETSTLGVRVRPLSRYEAEREVVHVETSFGSVPVKVKRLDGTTVGVAPEYEACRAIALARGLPLQEVYRRVQREAGERLLDS